MPSNEPFQQEALNTLAAIRAAAEILDDHGDLSLGDRQVFLAVIWTEAQRLQRMFATW